MALDKGMVVIADDITGAAEIAGTALRHGLGTTLATGLERPARLSGVTVVATDTRSGGEDGALEATARICRWLKGEGCRVFKKTDSVLRGHVAAELGAMVSLLGCDRALLMPQNPSRGRVISHGRYLVGGIPLDETPFRDDPEFPALSPLVTELLHGRAESLGTDDPMPERGGIFIADAATIAEMEGQLGKACGGNVLLAGGADLFGAMLRAEGLAPAPPRARALPRVRRAILVCGSTQSRSLASQGYVAGLGARECAMPDEAFLRGDATGWKAMAESVYRECGSVIVSVGKRENAGSAVAARLRGMMADIVRDLVAQDRPDLIVIEGGATAYATLGALGWAEFSLKEEYAPGIVGMVHSGTEIVLKPGSYPWGSLFG